MTFEIVPLTVLEKQKGSEDLQFIRALAIATAPTRCRLIVAGGYADDGALGRVFRAHRDLDIQIFGKEEGNSLVKRLFEKLLDDYPSLSLTDEGREDYYHLFKITDGKLLKVELSYSQTLESPFDPVKITIRKDGTESDPGVFDTFVASLEDVIFECLSTKETSSLS